MVRFPIEQAYLDWLVDKTGQPGFGRYSLLELMWNTPFLVLVHGDENRAWYGRHLRSVWKDSFVEFPYDAHEWLTLEQIQTSTLEVLLALSTSLYEQSDGTAPYNEIGWFWKLIENLKIREGETLRTSKKKIEVFLGRTYLENGVGSIFPLRHPKEDQREVEIWYQMMAYLLENGY